MKQQGQPSPEEAFNRIELLVVCSTIALLAAVTAPAVTNSNAESERAVCANNLRMIGRAIQSWAGDHGGQVPWRTLIPEGTWPGPNGPLKPGNAWLEFYFLSNYLGTPKILACPADEGVRRVDTWGMFLQSSNRGNRISYTIDLDLAPDNSRSWLSSDRNLRPAGGFSACSAKVNNAERITDAQLTNSTLVWTNGVVHGAAGHLLLNDGTVEFTSSERLRQLMQAVLPGDNAEIHFLAPR